MTTITVTRPAKFQPTDKIKGDFNNCMIHEIQPVVSEDMKGKWPREKGTGWFRVHCTECKKEDQNRYTFGYEGDVLKDWNEKNPVISGKPEILIAERNLLRLENERILHDISEGDKLITSLQNERQRLLEKMKFKINRMQQIAEHLEQFSP